jgi:uncharacterized protein (TIGR01777 family)
MNYSASPINRKSGREMRIVIIGGLGLIGSAFSKLAAAKGHSVVALTRKDIKGEQIGSNLVIKTWDGKNPEILTTLIDHSDVVINLAGENIGKGKWTKKRKEILLNSRLEPALALVRALSRCAKPPSTLIQASAIGVYGTGVEEKTEDSFPGDDYLAKFAIEWEDSTKAVDGMEIRRIIIRTGIVLDKSEGVLPMLMLPFKLMVGGPVSSGNQIYSWIHIKDEAAAILSLLENPKCKGIYNLTAPQPLNNREIAKTLAKVMKRPYWLPVPGIALKLALGEMSTLVLDGQKVLPKRLMQAGFHYSYPDLEEALTDLVKTA